MKRIQMIAATTVSSVGLMFGLVGVVGASPSISNTGPGSTNKVSSHSSYEQRVTNKNNIGLTNSNTQHAGSGTVTVRHNTTAGDATSGDAANSTSLSAGVSVDNSASSSAMSLSGSGSGSMDGSINQTGPDSHNTITNSSEVTNTVANTNTVAVHNTSNQTATTGSVTVSGNTTGGSATSGNASNDNMSTYSLSVSN
jgi:hypothetical protein